MSYLVVPSTAEVDDITIFKDENNVLNVPSKIHIIGQNVIKQLLAGDFEIYDSYAEAFTDADGIKNSINNTDLLYDSAGKTYTPGFIDEASGDTTQNYSTYTNPELAFDGDDGTGATKAASANSTVYLGKEFASSRLIKSCKFKAAKTAGTSGSPLVYLQTLKDSTWTTIDTTSTSADKTIAINDTIDGIRVGVKNNSYAFTATVYTLEYGSTAQAGYMEIDIPSGTFENNIDDGICVLGITSADSDATATFEFTNGIAETSGQNPCSLKSSKTASFNAFTSEPTKLKIRTTGFVTFQGVWYDAN